MTTTDATDKPRPRRISAAKFDPQCTLEECAKELGVTRERVRQIERTALAKCARFLAKHDLTLADFAD